MKKRIQTSCYRYPLCRMKEATAVKLLAAICACLMLLGAVSFILVGCGKKINGRSEALKTEHFTVNRDAFSLYYTETYYSFYNKYSSNISQMFDEAKPLDEQKYSDGNAETILGKQYDGTWQEYFTDEAIALTRQVLSYCEAAVSEGMGLSEEEDRAAEKLESDLAASAEKNGQTLDAYIKNLYGTYATLDGLKYASKLTNLVGRYMAVVTARMTENVTDEMIAQYYAEHSGDYEVSEYYQYALVADKTGDEEKDREGIAEIAADANRIKAAADEEEFVRLIREEYYENAMQAAKEQYYEAFYQSMSLTYSGEELERAVNERLETVAQGFLDRAINAIHETDVTYDSAYELGGKEFTDWLYGGKAERGEIRSVVTEDEDSYYIILVCLLKAPEKDEKELFEVGLAVFEGTDEGQKTAEDLANRFSEASAGSADLLKQVGESLNAEIAETVSTYYNGYYKARYGLSEVDSWFSSAGQGDCGTVRTTVSGNTFYAVMFKGESLGEGWYFMAKRDLISSRCDDWYAEYADSLPVTVDRDVCLAH